MVWSRSSRPFRSQCMFFYGFRFWVGHELNPWQVSMHCSSHFLGTKVSFCRFNLLTWAMLLQTLYGFAAEGRWPMRLPRSTLEGAGKKLNAPLPVDCCRNWTLCFVGNIQLLGLPVGKLRTHILFQFSELKTTWVLLELTLLQNTASNMLGRRDDRLVGTSIARDLLRIFQAQDGSRWLSLLGWLSQVHAEPLIKH